MASVGERIRQERESRNTTLDDMAVATGIGQSYLESLERGEYHELPGPAFGKLYIRAYAEVLGFDPQPWIDDYDREHRLLRGASTESASGAPSGSRPMAEAIARWRESKMAAGPEETDVEPEPVVESAPSELLEAREPAPEPEPKAEPAPRREARTPPPPEAVRVARRRILVPFLLVIALSLVVGFVIRGMSRTEPKKPAAAAPPPIKAAPVTAPPTPAPPVVIEPEKTVTVTTAAAAPVAKTPVPSADLTVTEFGVGRRIVNFELDGASDHFTEGDRVSFASRVLGGRRGNVIRHVWIYEGRAQQTMTLRLGGTDYRTHTNKTVGKAGAWTVEARDDKGRVLARTDFTVEPRSR